MQPCPFLPAPGHLLLQAGHALQQLAGEVLLVGVEEVSAVCNQLLLLLLQLSPPSQDLALVKLRKLHIECPLRSPGQLLLVLLLQQSDLLLQLSVHYLEILLQLQLQLLVEDMLHAEGVGVQLLADNEKLLEQCLRLWRLLDAMLAKQPILGTVV